MKYKQIVVIGSGTAGSYDKEAYDIGKYIAEKGWALISGGRGGIMEAVSKGANEANGIVIGITPGTDPENANKYCSIIIPSGIGHARNMVNVLSGDVIIAIGGSWGTLSEISYAQIFNRPVILCEFAEGWSKTMSSLEENKMYDNFFKAKNTEEVFTILNNILT